MGLRGFWTLCVLAFCVNFNEAHRYLTVAEIEEDKNCINMGQMRHKIRTQGYKFAGLMRPETPVESVMRLKTARYWITMYPWRCCPQSGCDTTAKSRNCTEWDSHGFCTTYEYTAKCVEFYYCFEPKKYIYRDSGKVVKRAFPRIVYKRNCEVRFTSMSEDPKEELQAKTCHPL